MLPPMLRQKNHYAYLVKRSLLPGHKNGGRVIKAQKTTTKRSQVTIAGQLRWHALIEDVWHEQANLNLPAPEFSTIKSHFMLNLDETCIMVSDRVFAIISDGQTRKHEKIMDDNRCPITVVHVGSASGSSGPQTYLAAGKRIECKELSNLEAIGAPPHSRVIMTPSAYMTDEAWIECAPHIAKGIRAMDVRLFYFYFEIMLSNLFHLIPQVFFNSL